MKKLISLLLCCLMVMGLMTACGSSKSSGTGIVGDWKATVSLSEFGDMGDMGEMADYIDADKLVMSINLTFTKDGKYTVAVDAKSIDKLIDVLCDGMEDYLKDMSKSLGMDYKEMMGGMSVREFMEEMGALEEFEAMKEEMSNTGEYTYENGVLTMDGEEAEAELKGNTLTVEIEGKPLTFKRK